MDTGGTDVVAEELEACTSECATPSGAKQTTQRIHAEAFCYRVACPMSFRLGVSTRRAGVDCTMEASSGGATTRCWLKATGCPINAGKKTGHHRRRTAQNLEDT